MFWVTRRGNKKTMSRFLLLFLVAKVNILVMSFAINISTCFLLHSFVL